MASTYVYTYLNFSKVYRNLDSLTLRSSLAIKYVIDGPPMFIMNATNTPHNFIRTYFTINFISYYVRMCMFVL